MADFQKTLQNSISITGVGLHTGREVNMEFHPAEVNTGYRFRRTDLDDQPIIEADVKYVTETKRGTSLEKDGVELKTVEHVLAAVVGMDIDNVLIDMDSPEPPIMDGSSEPFMAALEKGGIQTQDAERKYFVIKEKVQFKDEKRGIDIVCMPADEYQVTVMVDYDSNVLRNQFAHMDSLSEFRERMAACRTFSFLHELRMLLDNGLIKGGDLNNAIVYVDQEVSADDLSLLQEAFGRDDLDVSECGILNNLELKHPNEAARHKLLDVVGDLALLGRRIKGRIIATRPGHWANTEFAKKLKKEMVKMENDPTQMYDLNAEPALDIEGIMKILPHRPPFLLIDKILELDKESVVGLKNVTMNEPFFEGHFPGSPVMPGVLQIEAMAQVGGILVLNTVPDPENYLTYFLKIEGVKFKKMVKPGDTMLFVLKLASPIRRGICHMLGKGYVGSKLAIEAEMMAQIVKVKKEE